MMRPWPDVGLSVEHDSRHWIVHRVHYKRPAGMPALVTLRGTSRDRRRTVFTITCPSETEIIES